MSDTMTKMSPCPECIRLRVQYASATHKREWAKADLAAAIFSREMDKVNPAQLVHEEVTREWEAAKAELEVHLYAHNHKMTHDHS
jgi:hypothetical protein